MTLMRFDDFMCGIQDGILLQVGNTIKVKYQGAWLVVDNGYLKWSTAIPPLKVSDDMREIR